MRGYEIEVQETRRVKMFIMADSEEDAKDDAAELYDEHDMEAVDVDVRTLSDHAQIPEGERFWTGGPNGQWATA